MSRINAFNIKQSTNFARCSKEAGQRTICEMCPCDMLKFRLRRLNLNFKKWKHCTRDITLVPITWI